MKKLSFKPVYFVLLGVVLGLGGFFLILANPFGWKSIRPELRTNNQAPSPSGTGIAAAPTPYLVLPKGAQTYNVQGNDNNISKATSITLNPLDATKNQPQTLSVKITSKEPVETFNATINTDTGAKTHSLSLVSGDESNGTWEAQYTLEDTTNRIYFFVFNIITTSGNKTVTTFPVR